MLLLFINCYVKIKVLAEAPSDWFWLLGERGHSQKDLAVLLEKPFWSPGAHAQDKLAWEVNHGVWLLRPLGLQVWVGDKASTVLKRYMEERHTLKWKLEAFVWLLLIPSEKRYCFCRATQDWGRGISNLSWCVSLQLELCWLIIWCRVNALVLEICLLILIKNAVHLRGITWVKRGCDLQRWKPRAEQGISSVDSSCTPVKSTSQQALLRLISLMPKSSDQM